MFESGIFGNAVQGHYTDLAGRIISQEATPMASVSNISEANLSSVVSKIPRLRTLASELFLGDVSIDIESDPDLGKHFVVVSVEAMASIEEVGRRRKEWYNQTEVLLGTDCELVRLVVAVRE
jgi:hypothetical protein